MDYRDLQEIFQLLRSIDHKLEKLMSATDDLGTAISAEHVALQSLFTYLQGLPALLASAQGANDAELAALQSQVTQDTADIASALAAAPAEPAPAAPAEAPTS